MGNNMFVLKNLAMDKFKPNSIILITGASSGIGEELAYQYACRKVRLFLAARNVERLEKVSELCRKLGSECDYAICDVSKEDDCKKMVKKCVERYGGIDMLILNAGINAHVNFEDISDLSVYDKLMKTNFFGYLYPTKYCFDHLKHSRGQIVVISSYSGEVGIPLRTAYCASKFAVTGFFESLRLETEDSGVAITIVCPPSVATGMREKDAYLAIQKEKQASSGETHIQVSADGHGHVQNPNQKETRISINECVHYIMIAADKKARKVFFPTYLYLAAYIRPFVPWPIDEKLKQVAKL